MRRRGLFIYNDEPTLRSLRLLLEARGYEFVAQPSPIGASRVMAQDRLDFVLVDVTLPIMRSERLSSLIERWKGLTEAPIILIAPSSEWRSEWGPVGEIEVLARSELERDIVALLRSLVARSGARRDTGEREQFPLKNEQDMANALARVRMRASRLGVGRLHLQHLVTAVSELGRNILLYAGEGTIEFEPQASLRTITIRALDHGPGIKNIDEILSGRYRSKTGLGKGIRGVERLAKEFKIDTGPTGTRVHADFPF